MTDHKCRQNAAERRMLSEANKGGASFGILFFINKKNLENLEIGKETTRLLFVQRVPSKVNAVLKVPPRLTQREREKSGHGKPRNVREWRSIVWNSMKSIEFGGLIVKIIKIWIRWTAGWPQYSQAVGHLPGRARYLPVTKPTVSNSRYSLPGCG